MRNRRFLRAGIDPKLVWGVAAAVVCVVALVVLWPSRPAPVPTRSSVDTTKQAAPTPKSTAADSQKADAAATPARQTPAPSAPALKRDGWSGTVVAKATGRPIAGARIVAQAPMGAAGRVSATPLSAGQSDDAGAWSVDRPTTNGPMGRTVLIASAPGYATALVTPKATGGDPIRFELEDGVAITGTVVNSVGNPIAGALVGALPDEAVLGWNGDRGLPIVSELVATNETGAFTLAGVAADSQVRLPVRADGYVPIVSGAIEPGTTGLQIVLQPGFASVFGQVTTNASAPLVDSPVVLTSAAIAFEALGNPGSPSPFARLSVGTDVDGRFNAVAVPEGEWVANAYLPGAPPTQRAEPLIAVDARTVAVGNDGVHNVQLQVPDPLSLAGLCKEESAETPVAGVALGGDANLAGDPRAAEVAAASARTPRDGTFKMTVPVRRMDGVFEDMTLNIVPPDGYVWFRPPGTPWRGGMRSLGAVNFPVPEGLVKDDMILTFERGSLLTGRVLLSGGSGPAPGAEVMAMSFRPGSPNQVMTTTAADGTFRMTVPASGNTNLAASLAGEGRASTQLEIAEGVAPEPVELVLVRGATLSGRVVTAALEPVGGAEVRLGFVMTPPMGQGPGGGARRRPNFGMPRGPVLTAADGTFEMTDVDPGSLTLSATAPARDDLAPSDEMPFDVNEGEEVTGIELVLLEGSVLVGTVLDSSTAKPIVGATVRSGGFGRGPFGGGPASGQPEIKSDAEGRFRVGGLPANGIVEFLNVEHPDYLTKGLRNINANAGDIEVLMDPARGMELTVVDANNKPIEGYRWIARQTGRGGGPRGWNQLEGEVKNPEGKTRVSGLGMGRYRIEVTETSPAEGATKARKATKNFIVPDLGEPDPLTVTLGDGVTLKGRVVFEDTEEPAADATVRLSLAGRGMPQWMMQMNGAGSVEPVTTNSKGEFTFEGLTPDNYRALATLEVDGKLLTSEAVTARLAQEVSDDEDADGGSTDDDGEILLVLRKPTAIYGRVVAPDGSGVEAASISFRSIGQDPRNASVVQTSTDSEGKYRMEGLAAGRIQVSMSSEDPALSDSNSVELDSGEERELNFDFTGLVRLYGVVTLDGELYSRRGAFNLPFLTLVESGEDRSNTQVSSGPDGSYSIWIKPGTYRLDGRTMVFRGTFMNELVIAEGAGEMQQNFDLRTAVVEILMDLPDDARFRPGPLTIESGGQNENPEVGSSRQGTQLETQTTVFQNVPPGRYKASFSLGDEWPGESDWTEVAAGATQSIVIFFEPREMRVFELTVHLEPGEYQYKFFADPSQWTLDPLNLAVALTGQNTNNRFAVPGGAVTTDGVRQQWPRVNDSTGEVTFRWAFETNHDNVYVRGSFNNWRSSEEYRMKRVN